MTGKGRRSLWFLVQPIIEAMAAIVLADFI
jgi:hypothetical protein